MATMRKAGATLAASTTYNGIFMTFSVFPTLCLSVCLCVCVRSKYAMELGATPSRVLAIWLLCCCSLTLKTFHPN